MFYFVLLMIYIICIPVNENVLILVFVHNNIIFVQILHVFFFVHLFDFFKYSKTLIFLNIITMKNNFLF